MAYKLYTFYNDENIPYWQSLTRNAEIKKNNVQKLKFRYDYLPLLSALTSCRSNVKDTTKLVERKNNVLEFIWIFN